MSEPTITSPDRITGYMPFFSNFEDDPSRRDGSHKLYLNSFREDEAFEVGKVYTDPSFECPFEFWDGSLLEFLQNWVCDLDLISWNAFGNTNKNAIHFVEVSCDSIDAGKPVSNFTFTSKLCLDRELSFEQLVRAAIEQSGDDIEHNILFGSSDVIDILYGSIRDVLASSKDNIVLTGFRTKLMVACGKRAKLTASDSPILPRGFPEWRSGTKLITVGDYSDITSYCKAATLIASGSWSQLKSYGDFSRIVVGDFNRVTSEGDLDEINVIGDFSKINAMGACCNCHVKGENNYIYFSRPCGKFNGVVGTEVQIVNYNSAHERQDDLFAIIGFNNIKPNTWYAVQDGQFVEAGDDQNNSKALPEETI